VLSASPITSTSTGPIFTKFAGLVELWPWMNDLKLFFDPSRDVAVATNFVGKIDLQSTPFTSRDIHQRVLFIGPCSPGLRRRHTTRRTVAMQGAGKKIT